MARSIFMLSILIQRPRLFVFLDVYIVLGRLRETVGRCRCDGYYHRLAVVNALVVLVNTSSTSSWIG